MNRTHRRLALAAAALALIAASSASAAGRSEATPTVATPSPAALAAARDQVEHWLAQGGFAGFKVDEVMAFSNNDYAAVSDRTGKPAFELLFAPDRSWLMEEPASMMWNTK